MKRSPKKSRKPFFFRDNHNSSVECEETLIMRQVHVQLELGIRNSFPYIQNLPTRDKLVHNNVELLKITHPNVVKEVSC